MLACTNILNFNSHSLFKQPLSRPIFYYEDARNAKKHYQEINNDNRYDFQYEVLATQDIAIDLLHAGILVDREIQVNNYKKAARFSPLKNKSLYDELTDASKNVLRSYGIYLDVSNNIENDTYYLIQNYNVGASSSSQNVITEVVDNKLKFGIFPMGLSQHRNNTATPYNGFDISNTIYQSVFTVGDSVELFYDAAHYKDVTGYGRKYLKINSIEQPYHVEFIAGLQGTTNMTVDKYNDAGKLFSSVEQTDSANVDFSGWTLFTDREAAHEHFSSIIPFNSQITVSEPEHLLFQSNLNDLYENYTLTFDPNKKTGAYLVAGNYNYEQRMKNNLELYAVDPHKTLVLKGNQSFRHNKVLKEIHGVWDKTITQTSNFDMQEFLYYFKHNSTTTPSYIWDVNEVTGPSAPRYTWPTHNTYGLTTKTEIVVPDLLDNTLDNTLNKFKIPNYQASQTTFNSLSTNMYNPENPRSPFLTQQNYTAADVSNGTFVYNTFNKFYPRAEPLVEMYIKDVYRYDSKFNTEPISLGQLPKVTIEYEEPIYYHNERSPLTSDMSFVFNLNGDDNQYNRLYRNSYLNYINQTDITYSIKDTTTVIMNTDDSTGSFNRNTQSKHSGNTTIANFKPRVDGVNSDMSLNDPEWETKGKEVARYALLYTNDHRIEKPTLKPEYHGYYWKMTNYQGWTDETDISNSTELSAMIFHNEREKIGLYRSDLHYNENNDPDNKTNWTKWQIDDVPTFNNYDKWVYDQKQDIIHESLVVCDYNSDIFFNGIVKIHILYDNKHAFIFSIGSSTQYLSYWDIETHSLIKFRTLNSNIVDITVSKNIVNDMINIYTVSKRVGSQTSSIINYKFNLITHLFSFSGSATLDTNNTNNQNTDGFMIIDIDDYINVIYENDNTGTSYASYKNNAISYDTVNYYTGNIIKGICNNNSRIEGYVYDVIDGKKSVIFRSRHEISMYDWDGSDLLLRDRFNPTNHISSIGSLLDASFTDLYLEDSSTVLTTAKTSEIDYKLIKLRVSNNSFNMSRSVRLSNPSVGSSSNKIGALCNSARATPMRLCSPPDNCLPPSPSQISKG